MIERTQFLMRVMFCSFLKRALCKSFIEKFPNVVQLVLILKVAFLSRFRGVVVSYEK